MKKEIRFSNKKLQFLLFTLVLSLGLNATNLFWVGGTGNWNDASHWAPASGGAGGAGIPTSADNVFFDANSFTLPSQTVTINGASTCADMDWTNAAFAPIFSCNSQLDVYGSVTLITNMTWIGGATVYFRSTSTGKTITCAGQSFGGLVYFDGVGGGWTFQDAFTNLDYTWFYNGAINTNNQTFTTKLVTCPGTGAKTLNLGASDVYITGGGCYFDASDPSVNLTAGAATMYFTGAGAYLVGGAKSYNNIFFTNPSASACSVNGGTSFNKVMFSGAGTITPSSTYFTSIDFQNIAIINGGNGNFGRATFVDNAFINGNNSFDSLIFSAGKTYTLVNGKTQTINTYAKIDGTCSQPVVLKSDVSGSVTTLSSGTSTITTNYTRMQDVNANGGAIFTANNVVNLGNNNGWTLNLASSQNLYWVGGAGNWDDPNHWSTTSGGAPGTCFPTRYNNVYFDANSFTAGSKIVTLNVIAECDSMNWTGSTNTPVLTGTLDLNIYGSLKFISAMSNSFTGKLFFRSTTGGNTITSAGKSFSNDVTFDGLTSDWTLQDAFNTGATGMLIVLNGYLVTNDQTVSCYGFSSIGSGTRGLYLGNSTINVSAPWNSINTWNVSGTNFSVDGGTSTIKLTAAYNTNFIGGAGNYYYNILFQDATTFTGTIADGAGYNNVTFNAFGSIQTTGAVYNIATFNKDASFLYGDNNSFTKAVFLQNGTLIGNNTFDTLSLAGGKTYTLQVNKTQSVNTIMASSSCSVPVILQSNTYGTKANISSTLNNISVNYFQIQDINATGGMTFIANNSTDVGNNSGWTINAPTSLTLYWRGGSGNWNDANHWSLTSGGPGGACIPTLVDNVIFNGSSFSAGSKIVTLNVPAYCKNMTWTGATFTPVLTGTVSLNVYGSLTLISAMTTTGFTGPLNFKGPNTGNTITSAGKTFTTDVTFNGVGGYWTLQDAFTLGSAADLYMNGGSLNTNGKNVTVRFFYSTGPNVKQLILGTSTVTVAGSTAGYAWYIMGSNLTIIPGTSLIKFTGTGNSTTVDGGVGGPNGVNYYNIIFQNAAQGASLGVGNYHNVTFNGLGNIYGPSNFHKLDFKATSNVVNGNNIIDSLLFTQGTTTSFVTTTTTTVNSYFGANGTAGNLVTLTGTGTYTVNVPSCVVCCNYIDITNCHAGGGASFYADNSTNSGGNTGWNFAACPSNTLTVGPINGATNTCINTTGNVYSIPSLGSGATYTWTVPAGATITSGQGTSSIQITAGGAGTISVSATACGTTGSATKTITVNSIPVISSVSVTPSTCSHNDGNATATITSGSSPYHYQWSSGDTLSLADSLYSGQYQLNVSDVYGCVTSTVVTVIASNGPAVTLANSTNVTCPGGTTGSLTVSVSGGVAPYSYAWTTGATTATVNNLQAGTYVVTVTDFAGCQVVGSYSVTQPAPINITFTITPSACSSSTGVIASNVTGGTAGYTYLWSANAASQTTATASALAAGLYSVVVTDNAGCTKNASAMVSTNTAGASIALDNITAGVCGINGPGGVDITPSGGASPYTFNWSDGSSNEDLSGAAPGTYSLGVIDANGCMTYTSYVVPNANPNYQPEICLVTFDTTTSSNLVAWDKTGAVGIKQYNIYCEIGSYNNFQLVGTVSADSLSEFVHPGANPDVKSWKYKISATDSCGIETAQSSYHKTIHLQISTGSGGVQNLSWDNYYGFNYGGFEVWRHTLTNNWQQLTSIPYCGFTICTNTYTDLTPVPGDTNRYAILVSPPSNCVTSARPLLNNTTLSTITKSRSNVKNNKTGTAIGIKETDAKNIFAVYPNPATNEITILLNKDCSNCILEITNALGQTLKAEKLLSLDSKINISAFANGVYYVKIKSDNKANYVQKIVVQH